MSKELDTLAGYMEMEKVSVLIAHHLNLAQCLQWTHGCTYKLQFFSNSLKRFGK